MMKGSDAARAYKEKLLKAADSDKLILWMPTYRHASSERLNEETLNNEFNIPILDDKERLLAFNNFCRDNHVLVAVSYTHLGFDPQYTGKENIYLYGAMLGYTKKFIDSKYDEIVEFLSLIHI